jgi:hypothetical protein
MNVLKNLDHLVAPKNSVGITCLVNYVNQIELVGLFMDCFAITLFYILLAV